MSYVDTHEHPRVYITELHDHQNNMILPVTVVDAVYMPDKKTSIYDEIESWREESYSIEFLDSGDIKKTYTVSGRTVVTSFNANGTITDTCRLKPAEGQEQGALYYTRTTTFNADGSIEVSIAYAE